MIHIFFYKNDLSPIIGLEKLFKQYRTGETKDNQFIFSLNQKFTIQLYRIVNASKIEFQEDILKGSQAVCHLFH